MKELTKVERTTLSKIQRRIERAKGIENLICGGDILAELKKGILERRFEDGTFYRVMDADELRRVKTRYPLSIYAFVNRDREVKAKVYGGYEGLVQVEIRGRAVPYDPAEAEGEMLLYSTKNIRLIKIFRGETIYVLEEVKEKK